jgi:hypothetical protein
MLISIDEKFAVLGDYNYGVRIIGISEGLYSNSYSIDFPIEF